MFLLKQIINFLLHVDKNLIWLLATYGNWIYVILFVILFIETGLVVMPFLPGDSLLFMAGAMAANGSLNFLILWLLAGLAAVLGDTANYWIGHFLGEKVFEPHHEIQIFRFKIKI